MSLVNEQESADNIEKRRSKARWYAVQVASGCEKRVKANSRAANSHT